MNIRLSIICSGWLCLAATGLFAQTVVINEIFYHPASDDVREEFIELYNASDTPADLTAWRFSRGARFVFPEVTVPPRGYLVVAADVDVFRSIYTNSIHVIGNWDGILSNRAEAVRLDDNYGQRVDEVEYADEGDWAVRHQGGLDLNHRGWVWKADHDGGGKSLELVNPLLSNNCGQNWLASLVEGGTPGQPNSVAQTNVAPLILNARHHPIIPMSTDLVTVSARLEDETGMDLQLHLHHRVDGETNFTVSPMFDDGQHQDGNAGDLLFGVVLPPHPDGTAVEFFFQAVDASGLERFWPSFAQPDNLPQANLLYQVDDSIYSGGQQIMRLIMTEAERAEFLYMVSHSPDRQSDAQMNGTFIALDDKGVDLRYLVSIRHRGHGSRWNTPNNFRIDFPSDNLWRDVEQINLNAMYPFVQILGSAMCQKVGLLYTRSRPVQVRLNGSNHARAEHPMYGFYAHNEVTNGDFADYNGLGPVNIYRAIRSGITEADFTFWGDKPDLYRRVYFKESNQSEDDWSDLIGLCKALSDTPDQDYSAEVNRRIDVDQWLRYFALNTLFDNNETNLGRGYGDDYYMYCRLSDDRFVLLPYDLDTILGQGDSPGSATASLFRAARLSTINRFLKWPEFAPRYFQHLKHLSETIFASENFDPFLNQVLGGLVPESRLKSIKTFAANRRAHVLSQIPLQLTVESDLQTQDNYRVSDTPTISLSGQANAIKTRAVLVNGRLSEWTAWQAKWAIADLPIQVGITRILVQSLDAAGQEIERQYIDVRFDAGDAPLQINGLLSTNTVLDTEGGPYDVTGPLEVPDGVTLHVGPGTTVFFEHGASITVQGTLSVEGAETNRVRFTRRPDSTNRWNGIHFNDSKSGNRIAFLDMEFGDASKESISVRDSSLTIIGTFWRHAIHTVLAFENSSIRVESSHFPGVSNADVVIGDTIPEDGEVVFMDCVFEQVSGSAHAILFAGGKRPGPILQCYGNRFLGGNSAGILLIGADAHLEANTFHNYRDASAGSLSASAIRALGDASNPIELVVVRSVFLDNDCAMSLHSGAFLTAHNNTLANYLGCAVAFTDPARPDIAPGAGADLVNSIFYSTREPFTGIEALADQERFNVNFCLFSSQLSWAGLGNRTGEPRFVSNTDLRLRPGSPARRTGMNGLDMGAFVSGQIAFAGTPLDSPTPNHNARLTVWGPGIAHYQCRLDDGPYSAVAQIGAPIQFSSLSEGPHKLEVIGCNSAGIWQKHSDAAVLAWEISDSASAVVINEILAQGDAALDWIELYNRGEIEVDLSGMSITDDPAAPLKFVFPNGTLLEPSQYLLVFGGNDGGSTALNLGFSLRQSGESVFLFDGVERGLRLLGSVSFGFQLSGASIGRLPDGSWDLTEPTPGKPNQIQLQGDPDNLKINEWLARPATDDQPDFIELYNPDPLPVALYGLALSDRPITMPSMHPFPPLSFVAGNGFLVLKADGQSQLGADHLGFSLTSDQGLIGLSKTDGTPVDLVWYAPQRTGVSQGRTPDGKTVIGSLQTPTPGTRNPGAPIQTITANLTLLDWAHSWKFNQSGLDLGSSWKDKDADDLHWPDGNALLFAGDIELPAPLNSTLNLGPTAYYFRTHFNWPLDKLPLALRLFAAVDDGAVFYLNGHELLRIGFADSTPVKYNTLAERLVVNRAIDGPFTVSTERLLPGDNVLAVEVHQASANSSDIVFGMTLDALITNTAAPQLLISEILADNRSYPGPNDNYPDFVEFFNPSVLSFDASGIGVTDNLNSPYRWTFPSGTIIPGLGFFLLLSDPSQPASASNSGFGLSADGDAVYLVNSIAKGTSPLDAIEFGFQTPDVSLSRVSFAKASWLASMPTPNRVNQLYSQTNSLALRINEWMALPSSGPDWFEIFNPGPNPVDVGGFYLTDNPNDPLKSRIPNYSIIGGQVFQYRRIVADGDPSQGPDHANFRLSGAGEIIVLFDSNRRLIDSPSFGPQQTGISQGRLPDGSDRIVSFLMPSPGQMNFIDSDSDRMPDAWEQANLLDAFNPNDAFLDADGDGLFNLAEFIAGTDPNDPQSRLILTQTFLDGKARIQFDAVPGKPYVIEYRNNLSDGHWIKFKEFRPRLSPAKIGITDESQCLTPTRFYRISVE